MPGYHCPGRLKPYMNTVYLNKDVNDTLIFRMIDHSYDRVVNKLTRREIAELCKTGAMEMDKEIIERAGEIKEQTYDSKL